MKKRDFYGYATVTDLLIAKGVTFDPETVIFEVDDIDKPQFPMLYGEALKMRVRPVFRHQVIEQVMAYKGVVLGRALYVSWHPGENMMKITPFNAKNDAAMAGQYTMCIELTDDGYANERVDHHMVDVWKAEPLLLPTDGTLPAYMKEKEIREDGVFALAVFAVMHDGFGVEEIELPRNYRRNTKKRTGKLPSNYYRVVNVARNRKRYASSGADDGKKREKHLVRGHFRHVENHPLEWFNGDFWIPAHTRGGGDDKQTKAKRVYRVEL